jgi:phage repressor protein C with HTH and peptisase S24 domain
MIIIRKIVGHSMMPVLPPSTLVIGFKTFKKPKPGQIIIFTHEGKEKIKRVEKVEKNKVYVTGDNQADSSDSRQFGWVTNDEVIARIIWPRKLGKLKK